MEYLAGQRRNQKREIQTEGRKGREAKRNDLGVLCDRERSGCLKNLVRKTRKRTIADRIIF